MVPPRPWARSHQQHGSGGACGPGCGAEEDAAPHLDCLWVLGLKMPGEALGMSFFISQDS